MSSEPQWIVVPKWEEFQHYKDRTVPWIKFYAELLHDEEWLALPPRTRSLLCGIWLLYMSSRCALRALPRRLAGALNQQVTGSDIERLVQAGFITLESRPSLEHVQMASRPTRARIEEKRVEEEEKEQAGSSQFTQDRNGLPADDFGNVDPGLEIEIGRMLSTVTGKDDGTERVVRSFAERLPVGIVAKVRESSEGKPARYAVGALKDELRERGLL